MRMEESLPKQERETLHYSITLMYTIFPLLQAMKIPAEKAAMNEECVPCSMHFTLSAARRARVCRRCATVSVLSAAIWFRWEGASGGAGERIFLA